jgi:DNA-binding transcriptional ArsR family regulator
MLEAIVGGVAAERVLLYLQGYEEAYGREIATVFEIPISEIQKQLRKLEIGGILVSRLVGRSRLYTWNPRNPLVIPLRNLLQEALESLPKSEQAKYFRGRRRPRRGGKLL